jgi:hypothetical protein
VAGSGLFFALQGVGVVAWGAVADAVRGSRWWRDTKIRKGGRWVRIVGKAVNLVGTIGWLYLTAPLFADDVARCGIWLFEPLPVSFVKGWLGMGWWRWGGRWAAVEAGREWWLRGLAVY